MSLPKFKNFNLDVYRPGKSKLANIKNITKLSANESALGTSPKVKKILNSKNLKIFKYPDPLSNSLKKEISKRFKCDETKLICGSGSDEVIQMICQLFLNSKDEVIIPRYSFLMYRIYSAIVGAKVVLAEEKNFKVDINNILKKVSKNTKIVFIANPNNPTGTYLNYKELIQLRKKLRQNILLVIDDAYYEYMKNNDYKSGLDIFRSKENVFVLRTFSKIYGLASLRIGWGYGSKKIISALNRIRPPFNVNAIAQAAAVEALKDTKFIVKSVRHNLREANKLKSFLSTLNISTNPISANFLLLNFDECKLAASSVYKKLQSKGVILRNVEVGYKIKNKLRLTIGSTKENAAFMKAMKGLFN